MLELLYLNSQFSNNINDLLEQNQYQEHQFKLQSLFKHQSYNNAIMIICLLIGLFTAYLAFKCNAKENPPKRLLITLFAFFFSGLYLLYYFIRYVLLGDICFGICPNKLF
jgi:hypothetical protein